MADSQYDAWLVDLDGTLYSALWVKLAMAAELALFGWSATKILRQFRHEHEAVREEEQNAGQALAPYASPFARQLARTAEALSLPVSQVEPVVQDWMFERPGKWIRRFPRRALLAELRAFRAQGGRSALVSDYPAERKINALGARDLFDVIVANGEVHGPQPAEARSRGLSARRRIAESGPRALLGDR